MDGITDDLSSDIFFSRDYEDKNTIVDLNTSAIPNTVTKTPTQTRANDIYSCNNCQKKKVACSKELPCSYCKKRNIECVYETRKSQMVLGVERERESVLKGCDRCLQIMITKKRYNCDLMSPCYECMKLGLDCTYERYKKLDADGSLNDNNKILKHYILEEFIKDGEELDSEYLNMIKENEMFLASKDESNDDDVEVLQLFQDYSYWVMKKGFYGGIVVPNKGFIIEDTQDSPEIFDFDDFLTISVLATYAIENLGFMFLGLFYDPIGSIVQKPELLSKRSHQLNELKTVDSLLDECVLKSVALLANYYMDENTFYDLTKISDSKKLLFYKAHLDSLLLSLTKLSHFEDIRIVQILLILASTDMPIRYVKKFSALMARGFDLLKLLNLNKMSSTIDDGILLKFTFIQKNIYFKLVYFTYLYHNQLNESQTTFISDRHSYDFRRAHSNYDADYEDDDGHISFEYVQYKIGLLIKEFQDKEMVVYPRGLLKYFGNLQRKLKYFKKKNINQLIELSKQNSSSISNLGESLIINVDYYFLNWKLIKFKFTNSEKSSLKSTMMLVDEIFSAAELTIESLLNVLTQDGVRFRFYKYPSIMNCVVEIITFHGLYRIFNKSQRNIQIYEKLVIILNKFMECEVTVDEDDNDDNISDDGLNFEANPYLLKYITLLRLLDRFNSIKSLFTKNEIINKSIVQNMPFIILKEDVISIKSNCEDRVANIIPGMSTTIRNEIHSYNSRWDAKDRIKTITDYRENLYIILASFKDFI